MNIGRAGADDVAELYRLRAAAATDLTRRFGKGPWSSCGTEAGVRYKLRISDVLIGREAGAIVAGLRLQKRKPWSVDVRYFTPTKKALYLCDMSVHPDWQRRGIGRMLIEAAILAAADANADALRLNAYDDAAGAGDFYRKCGFTETRRASYRGVPLVFFERGAPSRGRT
jgi:ribosomal protein S18 acetylase RimI-like enzyme